MFAKGGSSDNLLPNRQDSNHSTTDNNLNTNNVSLKTIANTHAHTHLSKRKSCLYTKADDKLSLNVDDMIEYIKTNLIKDKDVDKVNVL